MTKKVEQPSRSQLGERFCQNCNVFSPTPHLPTHPIPTSSGPPLPPTPPPSVVPRAAPSVAAASGLPRRRPSRHRRPPRAALLIRPRLPLTGSREAEEMQMETKIESCPTPVWCLCYSCRCGEGAVARSLLSHPEIFNFRM
jgi:hypothetical protein